MDGHRFLRRAWVATLAMGVAGTTACGERTTADERTPLGSSAPATGALSGVDARRDPVMTAESQALLEAGNVAFRRKDYAAALTAYEKAARGSPEHPAPWMGIYMVARVRNDSRAMEAAEAELKRLDPGPPTARPAPDTAAANRAPGKTGLGIRKN